MNQAEQMRQLKNSPSVFYFLFFLVWFFLFSCFSAGFVPRSGSQALPLQRGTNDQGQKKNELTKLSVRPPEVCAKPCHHCRPRASPSRADVLQTAWERSRGAGGNSRASADPLAHRHSPASAGSPGVLPSDLLISQPGHGEIQVCAVC